MTDNTEMVAGLLREYGMAFRHSWAEVDGRAVLGDMNTFAAALDDESDANARSLRVQVALCPIGRGHWSDFCDENCGVLT